LVGIAAVAVKGQHIADLACDAAGAQVPQRRRGAGDVETDISERDSTVSPTDTADGIAAHAATASARHNAGEFE